MSYHRLILLAHDKSEKREHYKNLLIESDRGYEVATASSGEEAVEKATEQEYCVIILDVLMPQTKSDESAGRANQPGGIYALEKIRQKEPWVPVIMFSQSELDDEIMDKARALGIFDYIVRSHAHTDFKFINRVKNAEEIYRERKKALSEQSEIIYPTSAISKAEKGGQNGLKPL